MQIIIFSRTHGVNFTDQGEADGFPGQEDYVVEVESAAEARPTQVPAPAWPQHDSDL